MHVDRLQEVFDRGLAFHKAGLIDEAEMSYLDVLSISPDHPGALHLTGVIRQQQGRHEEALELIGKAIAVNPAKAVYRNNYGAALLSLERFAEARDSFERALDVCPSYADALANLGLTPAKLGDDPSAEQSFRKALQFDPKHRDARKRLATRPSGLMRGERQPAAPLLVDRENILTKISLYAAGACVQTNEISRQGARAQRDDVYSTSVLATWVPT